MTAEPSLLNQTTAYDRHSVLHVAAANGQIEILSLLLELFTNPDLLNRHKQTPLMLAAMYGRISCVKKLAEVGANILMFDTMDMLIVFKLFSLLLSQVPLLFIGYSGSHGGVVGSVLVRNLKTGVKRGGWDKAEVYFHEIPEQVIDDLIDDITYKVAGGLTLEHPLISPFVESVVGGVDGARVWRPTSEIQVIADAVGNWVAWSNNQIEYM